MIRLMRAVVTVGVVLGAACVAGCQGSATDPGSLGAGQQGSRRGSIAGPVSFGTIDLPSNGAGTCTGPKAAQIWTLTNGHGLVAKLTDFGATLVELHVPDKA